MVAEALEHIVGGVAVPEVLNIGHIRHDGGQEFKDRFDSQALKTTFELSCPPWHLIRPTNDPPRSLTSLTIYSNASATMSLPLMTMIYRIRDISSVNMYSRILHIDVIFCNKTAPFHSISVLYS